MIYFFTRHVNNTIMLVYIIVQFFNMTYTVRCTRQIGMHAYCHNFDIFFTFQIESIKCFLALLVKHMCWLVLDYVYDYVIGFKRIWKCEHWSIFCLYCCWQIVHWPVAHIFDPILLQKIKCVFSFS